LRLSVTERGIFLPSYKPSFTLRAAIIGIFLILLNIYWVILSETIIWTTATQPTHISLFYNAVFTLLALTLLNLLIKRFTSRLALKKGELLTIYVMICVASAISGHSMMQIIVSLIGHPFWYASPENEWKELFWRFIPKWASVRNKTALEGYYEGESTLYVVQHIKAWIVPIITWSSFIFVLVLVMLSFNAIIRKQWVEKEKLSYPVIQLPYQIANAPTQLLKNKVLWMGFGVSAIIDLLNGLHYIFPAVPELPVKQHNIGYLVTSRPWNAIGWFPISFYPFVIGLGYFIPLDLSFSAWFFFWFWKAELVLANMAGLSSIPEFPFINYQASGGYLALCAIVLWTSRKHFKQVIQKVINRKSSIDDSQEPLRYRILLLVLIGGLSYIFFFCYTTGMAPWVIIAFFVIYFGLEIAITRMRAELGTPVHDLHGGGPDILLPAAVGMRKLSPNDLTMFSMFYFLNRAHYSDVMPHQLEGFKMADRMGANNKGLFYAMLLAMFVGIIGFFWLFLHTCYHTGMEDRVYWFGWESYNRLQSWLTRPLNANYLATEFVFVGFLSTGFIAFMRHRFLWWGLHPAGYAISNSWGIHMTWLPIFLSWMVKWLILKYRGLKAHQKAIPFFFGLILGEFVVGTLWWVIGQVTGIPTYQFWY